MTTAPIPKAYVVRSGSDPTAHTLLAGARTALTVVFGLWPLSATMLAVAAMLFSH
jgi:dihydrodipicolinate synthase/N-acetylneuraminate lyase